MKKIYQFLCSMRFGMILLLLIAALCIAATALGMDSIYTSWYFIALFAMLGLNSWHSRQQKTPKVPRVRFR